MPLIKGGTAILQPTGPRPEIVRQINHSYLSRTGISPSIREDLNLLPLILVLQVQGSASALNQIFTGDTDGAGINKALEILRLRDSGVQRRFNVVKVPHHGSRLSHHSSTLSRSTNREDKAIAVVCVGSEYEVLPDRLVLADFLQQGWKILATTKRENAGPPASRTNYALQLAGQISGPSHTTRSHDIVIRWDESSGLAWAPECAEVLNEELQYYSSASDSD